MAKTCVNNPALQLGDVVCILDVSYTVTGGPWPNQAACDAVANPKPRVQQDVLTEICQNATTFTAVVDNASLTPGDNILTLNRGAAATCTASTASSITGTFTTNPTSLGALTLVVVNALGSSTPAVQIGVVVDCGTTLWYDDFTGTNGTALTAHTPNNSPGGVGYTDPVGTLEIQSNKAVSASGASDVYFDPGVTESIATITIAAVVTDSSPQTAGVNLSPRKTAGFASGVTVSLGFEDNGFALLAITDGVNGANSGAGWSTGLQLQVTVTETRITVSYNGVSIFLDSVVDYTNTAWLLQITNPTTGSISVDNLSVLN